MKQVNLNSPILQKVVSYLVFALIVHMILVWFGTCSPDPIKPTAQKVTVPAISGKFEPQKPKHIPVKGPEKDQKKPIIKWKDKEVIVENPLNTELVEQYVKAKDSIERLNLYLKSIKLNSFSSKFEDENLLLNLNGTVRGEVQEITPSYTIKKREVEIKPKETVFRLLAGAEVGSSIIVPKLNFKANLMFQNRKGDVISGSYDTDQTVWIGYNKSIFNIKR